MTRGFVTIATGDAWYYRIAVNLLHSYRLFSDNPMPFSLICDRTNKEAEEFDQVILMEDSLCSYLDKLCLPEYIPYDETIFIDADSLAFRDLNDFWHAFEGKSVFSAFGKDYAEDYPYAWFKKEDAGEFMDRVRSVPDFIGGVYFLRKTPHLEEFSATCQYILRHYRNFHFRQFSEPADEPVFALAMAVHGETTAGNRSLPVCFYPHVTRFEADFSRRILQYDSRYFPEMGLITDGYMIHWGSGNTRKPGYLLEEYKLTRMLQGKQPGKLAVFVAKTRITICYQTRRALRFAWRMLRSTLSPGSSLRKDSGHGEARFIE